LRSNYLCVCLSLTSLHALRYSPAGVAILDASGRIEAWVHEAGAPRKLEFELAIRFTEALALQACKLALGTELQLEGFLAPIRMHARSLRMHVQDMKIIEGH